MFETTREGWLNGAVAAFRPMFDEKEWPLPSRVSISCGWPRNQGGKQKPVGQAFDPVWTPDGTGHVFICPTLSDPLQVLEVTLHQLCRLAVGVSVGHSGPFVTLIREFGLAGKATATRADPGTPLFQDLCDIASELGTYPHSAMRDVKLSASRPPGGGWIKFWSPSLREKYILRVSPKSLQEYGPPKDPFGEIMITAT